MVPTLAKPRPRHVHCLLQHGGPAAAGFSAVPPQRPRGAWTFATRGDQVTPSRQWAIVNFVDPVRVSGQLLMGPYLIVHDDAKMARGEACTSFYRFDPKTGPKEEAVSFHCTPTEREVCARATFTTVRDPDTLIENLTEYQFAGDTEGHGVPK